MSNTSGHQIRSCIYCLVQTNVICAKGGCVTCHGAKMCHE
jgi:hypothetical protein